MCLCVRARFHTNSSSSFIFHVEITRECKNNTTVKQPFEWEKLFESVMAFRIEIEDTAKKVADAKKAYII